MAPEPAAVPIQSAPYLLGQYGIHPSELLRMLCEELPDALMEIYPQIIRIGDFRIFTFFNKLPPELRLRIWRDTFPSEVNIQVYTRGIPRSMLRPMARSRTIWVPIDTPYSYGVIPQSLLVNHESRAETLKYYRPLVPPNSIQTQRSYFCPATDKIVLMDGNDPGDGPGVSKLSSSILDAVRFLELRDMCFGEYSRTIMRDLDDPEVQSEEYKQDLLEMECSWRNFKNLEELTLRFQGSWHLTQDMMKECVELVRQHFQRLQAKDGSYKVPVVKTPYVL